MIGLRGAQQLQRWVGMVGMLLPMGWGWVHAGISLEFDCRQYGIVTAQVGEIEIQVMIDGDSAAPGLQTVPHGLFGYGFLVRFDGALWQPAPGNSVMIEPALDFFGFAAGASVTMGGGFVAIKGNINPIGSPWMGNQLATLRLRAISPLPPSTPLTVEIFEQTPNESVFVDGLGGEIDPQIVPRPSLVVLLKPPRVEWIPGVQPHARLTFSVPQGADLAVQWSRSMAPGDWLDLPGAPHNTGEYLDFTTADRRFYRLRLFDR